MQKPLMTFSLCPLQRGSRKAGVHSPVRNPPRCPKQSMEVAQGVKMRTKMNMKTTAQTMLHFICWPTWSRPRQFSTRQPIRSPINPQSEVEAPARTCQQQSFWLLTASEKMLPPIPQRRQRMRVRTGPKVCSTRVSRMKVENMLPITWMKLTWRKIALTNLQTSPSATPGPQLPPNLFSVSTSTSRKEPCLFSPSETSVTKRARSASMTKMVMEKQAKVGQKVLTSISQQFSSRGFFTLLPPETSSTRFYSAYLICSSVTAGLKLSQGSPASSSPCGLLRYCCMRRAESGGGRSLRE